MNAEVATPLDRIEARRAALGISQKELCRRAGLDESTLAQAHRQKGEMRNSTLDAFAGALDCTLADLLGIDMPPASAATIPLRACFVSALNPRKHFDPEALAQLAETIAAQGVLQPILVRPSRDPQADIEGPRFEVVNGARRVKAAGMLVAERRLPLDYQIPAVVRDMDDAAMLLAMGVENLARADMTPLEEADYFAALKAAGRKEAEIARDLGVGERTVWRRLSLLHLVPAARDALAIGGITQEVATALTRLPAAAQEELLDEEDLDEALVRERIRDEEAQAAAEAMAKKFEKVLKPGMYVRTASGSGPFQVDSTTVVATTVVLYARLLHADGSADMDPAALRRISLDSLEGTRVMSTYYGEIIVISAEEARRLAAGGDDDDEIEGDDDADDDAEGVNRQDAKPPSAHAAAAGTTTRLEPDSGNGLRLHTTACTRMRALMLADPERMRGAQLVMLLQELTGRSDEINALAFARLRELAPQLLPLLGALPGADIVDILFGPEEANRADGLLDDEAAMPLLVGAFTALDRDARSSIALIFAADGLASHCVDWPDEVNALGKAFLAGRSLSESIA